jgi:hypothetical protein
MAPPATHVSAKNKRAIMLGRKIVRVNVGRTRESFTIHEDLLCNHSFYFRRLLQRKRKEIEGDCPICFEPLQPGVKELTFCKSKCGCNFHYKCIKQWEEQRQVLEHDEDAPLTCPHCRSEWNLNKNDHYCRCYDMDEAAYGIYVEWIYSHQIEVPDQELFLSLPIDTYLLGVQLEDEVFRKDVLEACLEYCLENKTYFSVSTIEHVYSSLFSTTELRKFVVDLLLCADCASGSSIWNLHLEVWDEFNQEFMEDLLQAFKTKEENGIPAMGSKVRDSNVEALKEVLRGMVD